jgi:hypothetical protein
MGRVWADSIGLAETHRTHHWQRVCRWIFAAYRIGQLSEGSHHAQYAPVTGERTLRPNAGPSYDLVAFLTPKRSLVDIVQATGRAMRKSPATQKTTGYVLVPLFLEQVEGETIETAVARAQFDEVWVVFQALQEHDEVLAEIIRHMREERGRTKGADALTRRLGQ